MILAEELSCSKNCTPTKIHACVYILCSAAKANTTEVLDTKHNDVNKSTMVENKLLQVAERSNLRNDASELIKRFGILCEDFHLFDLSSSASKLAGFMTSSHSCDLTV